MLTTTRGFCGSCLQVVPARHRICEGRVYLDKICPRCGTGSSLVSSDAAAWQRKRDQWGYRADRTAACRMECHACGVPHEPTIVFLDVTNRCNMNCPICIANIAGMGFEFHPPLAYFEKVFDTLAKMEPAPMVELFGGEPTVRDDLQEIIAAARERGVKTRVVTNGLRLADEDYCRRMCEQGVRFRIGIDGCDAEVYRRLRRNPGVHEKKLRALENLRRYSRRKHAILCCAARRINEDQIGGLIRCCHEYQNVIDSLGLLPLTEMWEPGTFETDVATTREDAEHMVERGVPGGAVEFIPAGIMHSLRQVRSFLKPRSSSDSLMFGGVHPDCETMTLLTSNGREYVSINHYLKIPLSELTGELRDRCEALEPALSRLDPSRRLDRWRARAKIAATFIPLGLRAVRLDRVPRGRALEVAMRFVFGLLRGRRAADLAREHLNLSRILRVAILPFEEVHSIDATRLMKCKAAFAYEDVEDGQIKTIPACVWAGVYRNRILTSISRKYGIADRQREPRLPTAVAACT